MCTHDTFILFRLRTLSSQGGGSNAGPSSPNKPLQTPTTPLSLVKKFKLAEHRYGKEELLQMFVETAELPPDMPLLHPICTEHPSPPLAFLPLSEEEQVRKCGVLYLKVCLLLAKNTQ